MMLLSTTISYNTISYNRCSPTARRSPVRSRTASALRPSERGNNGVSTNGVICELQFF